MQVAQFLHAFAFAPDIAIVESFLPDVLRAVAEEAALRRVAFPFRLGQKAARKIEFESLHDRRRILRLRFTDQKVDVLGHDDVSGHDELVATSHLLQNGEKQLAPARYTCVPEKGAARRG